MAPRAVFALLALLALLSVAFAADTDRLEEEVETEAGQGAAITGGSSASNDPIPPHESAFSRADSNADGMLTKEEYVGFFRKPLEKMKTVSKQAVEASDKIRGDIFARLDVDKDGKLTRDEWHGGHKAHLHRGSRRHLPHDMDEAPRRPGGPSLFQSSPEEKAESFAKADTDSSNTLTQDEFVSYIADNLHPHHAHKRRQLNPQQEEMRQAFQTRRREQRKERFKGMFAMIDKDSDGVLSKEEFVGGLDRDALRKASHVDNLAWGRGKHHAAPRDDHVLSARENARKVRAEREEQLAKIRGGRGQSSASPASPSEEAAPNPQAAAPATQAAVPQAAVPQADAAPTANADQPEQPAA